MAKSKLLLDAAHILDTYQGGPRLIVMSEASHAAVVGLCERLQWEATWTDWDASAFDLAELALNELLTTMPLQDVIDLLTCICENTGLTADGFSLVEQINQDNQGRTIRKGTKNFPKPGDPEIPYGASTWEDALALRCQHAQRFATAGLEGFQWIEDNFQPFKQYFLEDWSWQLLREIIDRMAGFIATPLGAFWKLWDAAIQLLSDMPFLDQWATNYNDIVCEIYMADDPQTAAANLIAGPLDLWPFGSYVLGWLLESVYTGEEYPTIGGDPVQRDVSEYSAGFCDACGQPTGPQTVWLDFQPNADQWDYSAKTSNWNIRNYPQYADSLTYVTSPATVGQTFPQVWQVQTNDNNVVGNFGTRVVTVPLGVSNLTAYVWAHVFCNDNFPAVHLAGSVSGSAGPNGTVSKSVTAGESLTVTLLNMDFGSNQCEPLVVAIELVYT